MRRDAQLNGGRPFNGTGQDCGDLLANLVRWAANEALPLRVEGAGLVDCHLYRQPGRLVLHLVNLTNAGTWRTPVHELIPIGPLRGSVSLPAGGTGEVQSLVAGGPVAGVVREGWVHFEIESITDHEVLVIG